jgi:Uma2 family endonuclease
MAVQQAYTVQEFEDFVAQPENAEWHFELIDGEIVKKMPTMLHAFITALLTGALLNFLQQNPIGRVLVEARYRLPGDERHDLIPDLSFVSKEKPLVSKGAAPFMPDLAVEVQSPGQSDKFMADKADYYLAKGVRMVWLVYPEKRIVEVLTPDDRHLLNDADTLEGGDVLPGFSLPIRDIFAE